MSYFIRRKEDDVKFYIGEYLSIAKFCEEFVPVDTTYDSEGEIESVKEQPKLDARFFDAVWERDTWIQYNKNLLAETDWIVIKHTERGTAIPDEWKTYRDILRANTDESQDNLIVNPQIPEAPDG